MTPKNVKYHFVQNAIANFDELIFNLFFDYLYWFLLSDFWFILLLRWFVDNEIVPGNHGTEYRIKSISRRIHNKIVKCEVNNVIGKSEETETLDIQCE